MTLLKSVIGIELVAHFVGHIINKETVSNRFGRARDAVRLTPANADYAQASDAAAACAENVADVVIGAANDAVEGGLVLGEYMVEPLLLL